MEELWKLNSILEALICCFLTKWFFHLCTATAVKKREQQPLNPLLELDLYLLLSRVIFPNKGIVLAPLCINSINCLHTQLIRKCDFKQQEACDSG